MGAGTAKPAQKVLVEEYALHGSRIPNVLSGISLVEGSLFSCVNETATTLIKAHHLRNKVMNICF